MQINMNIKISFKDKLLAFVRVRVHLKFGVCMCVWALDMKKEAYAEVMQTEILLFMKIPSMIMTLMILLPSHRL